MSARSWARSSARYLRFSSSISFWALISTNRFVIAASNSIRCRSRVYILSLCVSSRRSICLMRIFSKLFSTSRS
uniref:Putative secreted protein n=1 Tax=Anopheles darlingi TaxID=43151 RepID=A0A2M4D7R6_ANODA